ncbi:MAG: hypothetical protein F6J93_35490 [Oscillatoria sp. SIO1A7]|nr:hypothetical protein [Oscillatoria sp. SIO1A7]
MLRLVFSLAQIAALARSLLSDAHSKRARSSESDRGSSGSLATISYRRRAPRLPG